MHGSHVALSQADSSSYNRTFFSPFTLFPGQTADLNTITNDSILKLSQFYDKGLQKRVHVARTGNPGSASFFSGLHSSDLKFYNHGFNQFEDYLFHPLRNKIGDRQFQRYTNIDYHLGSKKEQHILIRHEQKIKPWFIAGFDFGALGSQGDFSRQLNSNRNFDIYVAYEAPSSVYRIYSSFTSNKILNQENGGITTDTIFENASNLDTRTLPVNLIDANINNRTRDYVLKQDLNLSRLFSPRDSTMNRFNDNSFVLTTSTWWSRKSVLFTSSNPDSGYFDNTYYDTLITNDSSFYNDLYNTAQIEYSSGVNSAGFAYHLGAGVENQNVEYFTYDTDTTINSTSILVLGGLSFNKLVSKFAFIKNVDGDCKECYRGNLEFNYNLNKFDDKAILSLAVYKSPQLMKDQFYISNHFRWRNNFDLIERYEVNAGVTLSRLKLNVLLQSSFTKNQLFYREDCLPQTYNEVIAVSTLSIGKITRFRSFGWDNKLELNNTGNENVVSVPLAAIYSSVYFQKNLFKNALGFKMGVDVNYFTEYYGYGYNPAVGVFYIQDEKQIGNYPRLGGYVNLKIKSAFIFIKVENFNSGIGERTYYGALHYPLPGRTLKFGVNWTFKD